MSNVIPLKSDYLRQAFELIESLNDTWLSQKQEKIVEQALCCIEKQIERHCEMQQEILRLRVGRSRVGAARGVKSKLTKAD